MNPADWRPAVVKPLILSPAKAERPSPAPTPGPGPRTGNRAFRSAAVLILGFAFQACSSPPVTIRAGHLLDGRGREHRDMLITVVGSTIRSVAPYQGEPVTWDLSRYTVLPGLIDAHVHIGWIFDRPDQASGGWPEEREALIANARATVLAGFTTVASMGAPVDRWLRDAVAAGRVPGPWILTSLRPFTRSDLSPDELRQEVWKRKRDGADFIKIFDAGAVSRGGAPTLSPEQLGALCSTAHQAGLRAVVHAQSDDGIRDAVQAGCDQIEHGSLATSEGLRAMADRPVWFGAQCRLVLANYLENRARFAARFDSAGFARMEQFLPVLPAVIRSALATPGLRQVYGSDAVAGAHGRNAEDLICRVREAGQSPMDALVLATSVNAAGLGLENRIGTIAPGFQADLIALDGNPLEAIEAVRKVVFVMREGKTLKH